MDRIILDGIEFYAYGGVTPSERQVGQRYRVHLAISLDLSHACESDDLNDSVSYAEAFALVVQTARQRPFHLIESLAGRIAQGLLHGFPVDSVTVRVEKLLPPIDGTVASASVEITRERKPDMGQEGRPR